MRARKRLRNISLALPVAAAAEALTASLRPRISGHAHRERAWSGDRPPIYAFFHGRQLYLLPLRRQEPELTILTSLSADGDLLTRILGHLGVDCVRGSSSHEGWRGLLLLRRLLRAGCATGVAVDGPRGPWGEVKAGVLALARSTGAPIVPVAGGCARPWRLRSWDRFEIPPPFAAVRIAFGRPLWVQRGCPEEDLEEARQRLQRRLWALAFRVDEGLP